MVTSIRTDGACRSRWVASTIVLFQVPCVIEEADSERVHCVASCLLLRWLASKSFHRLSAAFLVVFYGCRDTKEVLIGCVNGLIRAGYCDHLQIAAWLWLPGAGH